MLWLQKSSEPAMHVSALQARCVYLKVFIKRYCIPGCYRVMFDFNT